MQTAHHKLSAVPGMSSESNCYEIVVLPNGGYEEGERI